MYCDRDTPLRRASVAYMLRLHAACDFAGKLFLSYDSWRSGRSFSSQARNVDRYLPIIVLDLVFCGHYSASFGRVEDSKIRSWTNDKGGMEELRKWCRYEMSRPNKSP